MPWQPTSPFRAFRAGGLGETRPTSRCVRPRWAAAGIIGAGLCISVVLTWVLYQQAGELDEARFEIEANYIAASLERNMERYEERLARLADHCAAFDELPTLVWYFRRSVMTDLNGNLPAVVHAVHCPKILARHFESHLLRGCEVWLHRYQFDAQERPGREYALPVWQQWSRNGFVSIPLGTDMAGEEPWHPPLAEALAYSAWISPHPVCVAMENGKKETGFWFAMAIYKPNQKAVERRRNESMDQFVERVREGRANAANGVFAAFISTDRLINLAFNERKTPNRVHVRLYASRQPSAELLLTTDSTRPTNPRHRRVIVQPWYRRRWSLEMESTPFFEKESPRGRAWLVLGAGIGFTVLTAAMTGVSLRARLRQEQMTAEVIEARDALLASEKEREKIGHDLHDNSIQSLYSIQLRLGHTMHNLARQPSAAISELSSARAELDAVIQELRRFITQDSLPAGAIDLADVLRSLVQRAQSGNPGRIQCVCSSTASSRLPPAHAVQLANIAREALSNAIRHSRATKILVRLFADHRKVELEIRDNGIGFTPDEPPRPGVGLGSLQKRAGEIGASLSLRSTPGQGCTVLVELPTLPAETS